MVDDVSSSSAREVTKGGRVDFTGRVNSVDMPLSEVRFQILPQIRTRRFFLSTAHDMAEAEGGNQNKTTGAMFRSAENPFWVILVLFGTTRDRENARGGVVVAVFTSAAHPDERSAPEFSVVVGVAEDDEVRAPVDSSVSVSESASLSA